MKALIIEDEALAVTYLRERLVTVAPDFEVVGVIDSTTKAIEWLSNFHADIIFLDIHLGDDNCFTIFEKVKIHTPVIFTTAYDQYAMRAFKLNSIDYLLKPFSDSELRQAIDKFRHQASAMVPDIRALMESITRTPNYKERFMVISGQKIRTVPTAQVAYFISEGRYARLVTRENEKFLLDDSLSALEQVLDPKKFYRVNRQIIVSIESIRQMVIWSRSRLKLELKPQTDFDVIVSIDNASDFKRWLNS